MNYEPSGIFFSIVGTKVIGLQKLSTLYAMLSLPSNKLDHLLHTLSIWLAFLPASSTPLAL